MANEYAASLKPGDVISAVAGSVGTTDDPYRTVQVALGKGIALPPNVTSSTYQLIRVPNAAALATGLTVSLVLTDDPLNTIVGKNVYFDAVVGPVTSGTTTFDENATTGAFVSTTPVAAAFTIPAASAAGTPALLVGSIALPIANLNGLTAGGWAIVRVRRLGGNVLDTGKAGRAIVFGIDFRNT